MICHGNGDLTRDGCCYVAGQVCPLRLKIVNNHVYNSTGTDLGTVQEVATSYGANKPQRDRASNQLQGITFVCRAAVEAIIEDSRRLTNRDSLVAAWHSHPDYLALVRPAWAELEQKLGLPTGSYNCGTWKGTGGPQCCFAETQTENDLKSQGLTSEAKNVRIAGGT
jgi:hypothetical protein